MAKKRYWMCVYTGRIYDLQIGKDISKKDWQAVGLGRVVTTVRNQEPQIFAGEVWYEISEEAYRSVKKDREYIVKYDGVHCIGTCDMCKFYKGTKYLPALGNPKKRIGFWGCSCPVEERPYFKDNMFGGPNNDKSCCVLKEDT